QKKKPSVPSLLRPYNADVLALPSAPKPYLDVCNGKGGIILKWNMPSNIPPQTYGQLKILKYSHTNSKIECLLTLNSGKK
ncbi:hypothetical protein TNCV_1644331, partial [Trichonephila clavipes]